MYETYERVYTMCNDRRLYIPPGNRINEDHNLVFDVEPETGDLPAFDDRTLCQPTAADRPGSEAVGSVAYAVLTPFRLVLIPLVDSIGQSAWEEMVRRTRLTIRRETELNGYAWNAKKPIA